MSVADLANDDTEAAMGTAAFRPSGAALPLLSKQSSYNLLAKQTTALKSMLGAPRCQPKRALLGLTQRIAVREEYQQCPTLTKHIMLRAHYEMSSTDTVYCATRPGIL